jgi:acyl-CoA reductase-like NAD-dependent aldehyde dehydrogenase
MIGPLVEAIFAGNGIVIKGSEQTAWSAQYNVQVARNALATCGHDPDLVQVISMLSQANRQSIMCFPDVAEHLTSHPDIKHILFIGSKTVAHKVAESASKVDLLIYGLIP